MELSEEEKAEIREAVRIVREDRFERHAREVLGKHKSEPQTEPEPEPESEPEPEPVKRGNTPPAKDPEPEPVKRKVWGNYASE